TLKFGKTSAKVDVIGPSVIADVRHAALMGGDLAVKAIVSIDPKDPTFSAAAKLNRVNFAKLTKLYFNYDTSKGVMSGNYKFNAIQGRENLMRGSGNIRVEDGNVFAIPILGPFSEILGTILPGVGYQTAHVATADFTVANEIINTKNLVIEGAGFRMHGAGDIYFMTSRLDMSMRINARGIPGIVFYPVSKLLEYISTGTVGSPAWRPRIIPRLKAPDLAKPREKPLQR
ncbi:MAG: AsmA-like C-terminal region-containing protein, partial [Candidatus Omnitrophota bacterium]